jgi:hypothetical protein
MCIAVSLPARSPSAREQICVEAVIETLLFQSNLRQVVVSFDCIISNQSDEPVDVWMTHVDNVEGRLATEDWRSDRPEAVDERTFLLGAIHEGGWQANFATGLLRYRDPVHNTDEPATVARMLSYRPAHRAVPELAQIHSDFIDTRSAPYLPPGRGEESAVYKLLSFPEASRATPLNCALLPFTTFRVGPIMPSEGGVATAFRLTVLVANDSYFRLVQPQDEATFYVYGAERVLHEIQDENFPEFQRDPRQSEYQSFFASEIVKNLLTPAAYQVIIVQPPPGDRSRRCILARPTSPRISERVISDPAARQRALWFNAWSPDFSMALKYGDRGARDFEGYRIRLPRATVAGGQ